MIEVILSLSLFGSVLVSILAMVLYLALCFYNDVIEDGIAAFVIGIILIIVYGLWSSVDFKIMWQNFSWVYAASYLGLGLLHAIIRSFFYGRAAQLEYNRKIIENPKYNYSIDLDIKGNVFRWWLMWPISLIVWFLKDMVKEIYDYFYKKFGKLFEHFLNLGMKSV